MVPTKRGARDHKVRGSKQALVYMMWHWRLESSPFSGTPTQIFLKSLICLLISTPGDKQFVDYARTLRVPRTGTL